MSLDGMTDFRLKTLANDLLKNLAGDVSLDGLKKKLEDAVLEGDEAVNKVLNSIPQQTRQDITTKLKDKLSPQTLRVIKAAEAALYAGNIGEFLASDAGKAIMGDVVEGGINLLKNAFSSDGSTKKQPAQVQKRPGHVSFKKDANGATINPFFLQTQAVNNARGQDTKAVVDEVVELNKFQKTVKEDVSLGQMDSETAYAHYMNANGREIQTGNLSTKTPSVNSTTDDAYQKVIDDPRNQRIFDKVKQNYEKVRELDDKQRSYIPKLAEEGDSELFGAPNGERVDTELYVPEAFIREPDVNPFAHAQMKAALEAEITEMKSELSSEDFLKYQKDVLPELMEASDGARDVKNAQKSLELLEQDLALHERSLKPEAFALYAQQRQAEYDYLKALLPEESSKQEIASTEVKAPSPTPAATEAAEKDRVFKENLDAAKSMSHDELKAETTKLEQEMASKLNGLGQTAFAAAPKNGASAPATQSPLQAPVQGNASVTQTTGSAPLAAPAGADSIETLMTSFIELRAEYEAEIKDLALKKNEMKPDEYFAYSQVKNMDLQRLEAIVQQMLQLAMQAQNQNIKLMQMSMSGIGK